MKRIYVTVCVASLVACSAAAQDLATQKQAEALDKVKAEVDAQLNLALNKMQIIGIEGGLMSSVKSAPYSAEQISENTQTLGDGTRIHNENAVKIYRDGEGRVRRETSDMISIFDPVAGVGYTLNPNTMTGGKMQVSVSVNRGPNSFSYSATATSTDPKAVRVYSGTATAGDNVSVMTSGGKGGGAGAGTGVGGGSGMGVGGGLFYSTSGPNIAFTKTKMAGKVETLPTQIMEGVNVQGERRTQTIEAFEIGNDRPIEIVNERWYSPELQLEIMTRHSDPRSGEQITKLVNIRRAEPDATLFQVPAGYQISEGKGFPAMKMTTVVKDH